VNGTRWLTAGPRQAGIHVVRVGRRLAGDFLAIAGIVAFVLGLLYRFAAWEVPHLLQARTADSHRGTECLLAGAVCLLAGRLIRPRGDRSLGRAAADLAARLAGEGLGSPACPCP
jgi:hypothetical protein